MKPLTENIKPGAEPADVKGYEGAGGYQALRRALLEMDPGEIQKEVKESNLRGRGGAGFPTGLKWSFVPKDAKGPRYIVCNADEMEPGTFKDRVLLEGDPHMLVEAMVIAGRAIGATAGYIFLRWAYRVGAARVQKAIDQAYEAGYLGKDIVGSGYDFDLVLHVSAGRYMAGEETGLLNALEGKRAQPRAKPPYPQISGLWGKPTIVQNVETLCCIPHIVSRGAEWFKELSRSDNGGTKLFGVSGRVKNPGVYELPLGVTVREVFEEHAGGMQDGFKLRGYLPGGASTDFLGPDTLDVPFDYETIEKAGSRMGTGTAIVLDDKTCPVGTVLALERFFARESCGWCTPCRDGLSWSEKLLLAIEEGRGKDEDLKFLDMHARLLGPGNTFCALAPGAAAPLQSALKLFREDFERHIVDKRCPWR